MGGRRGSEGVEGVGGYGGAEGREGARGKMDRYYVGRKVFLIWVKYQ